MWDLQQFEWESLLEVDLFSFISGASLIREVKDFQKWGSEDSGLFSVKFAFTC